MHYPLLLLLLVATSASATTTKCTKDVATDYAELLVADVPAEDVEATYALFEAFVDLNTWKLIDEIDGNTDGIKKNDDLSCNSDETCYWWDSDLLICLTRKTKDDFTTWRDNYGRTIGDTGNFELADGQIGNMMSAPDDPEFRKKLAEYQDRTYRVFYLDVDSEVTGGRNNGSAIASLCAKRS